MGRFMDDPAIKIKLRRLTAMQAEIDKIELLDGLKFDGEMVMRFKRDGYTYVALRIEAGAPCPNVAFWVLTGRATARFSDVDFITEFLLSADLDSIQYATTWLPAIV